MKKQKTNKVGKTIAVTAGAAALAAGAYYFLGPNGKKNQKKAKAWAIKMKADIAKKVKKAEKMTEPMYHKIVDSVAGAYTAVKNADHPEIMKMAQMFKKEWKTLSKEAAVGKKVVKKTVKKAVRAVKKTSKK